MNNKGQSLVLFIILIPILLGILALTIDVGIALNKKNEINNILKYTLDYGLKEENNTLEDIEQKEKNLEVLLNYNLNKEENDIKIEKDTIIVSSKTYVEGIFSNILDIKGFYIESEYKGYIENGKKRIQKVK